MLVHIVDMYTVTSARIQELRGAKYSLDDIRFTTGEAEECDLLIVLNQVPRTFTCRVAPENTWILSSEPPLPAFWRRKYSYPQFAKVFTPLKDRDHPNIVESYPFIPTWIGKSHADLERPPFGGSQKDKILSIISSSLTMFRGHRLRNQFQEQVRQSDIPLDVYGRGNPIANKREGLDRYRYTLSIENAIYKNHWTEKIGDAFVTNTLPFYSGCPNLVDFFPEDSFIRIDPRKPAKSLRIIRDAIENDEWSKRQDALLEARNLYLRTYQPLPFLVRMKKEFYVPGAAKKNMTFYPEIDGVKRRYLSWATDVLKERFL